MNQVYAEIARYCEIAPQYREPLNFLKTIIEFQSSLAAEINADMGMTGQQAGSLQVRKMLQSGRPLFEKEFLPIPPSLFLKGLERLRTLLPEESTRAALERLLQSTMMVPENIETVLHELKDDADSCIRHLAEAASTKADVLHFLMQTVLSPFYASRARLYRDLIDPDAWRRGNCPMCGSEPAIARLAGDDGRRFLACPLCNTEWVFARLRCPFCENEATRKLRHFTFEDDEVHRVECCDTCRRYLKVVDERVAGHRTVPPVEDVVTAHLDLLAVKQGYVSHRQ